MTPPLRRKNVYTRVKENRGVLGQERRKPNLPGPYIYVSGGTGSTTSLETWQSPEWSNSFDFVSGREVGFRHALDGDPEFVGQLDLTLGAVTGTVAFQLPVPYRSLSFEFVFPIFTGGTDWINGIFAVDATTGDCTVYWPVQATPI